MRRSNSFKYITRSLRSTHSTVTVHIQLQTAQHTCDIVAYLMCRRAHSISRVHAFCIPYRYDELPTLRVPNACILQNACRVRSCVPGAVSPGVLLFCIPKTFRNGIVLRTLSWRHPFNDENRKHFYSPLRHGAT